MIQLPILKMKQWKCFIEVKTFYQIHEKISFSKTFEKWCTTDEGIALQMRWVLFLLVSGSLMISDFGDSYRIDRACELVNTISVFSKTIDLKTFYIFNPRCHCFRLSLMFWHLLHSCWKGSKVHLHIAVADFYIRVSKGHMNLRQLNLHKWTCKALRCVSQGPEHSSPGPTFSLNGTILRKF